MEGSLRNSNLFRFHVLNPLLEIVIPFIFSGKSFRVLEHIYGSIKFALLLHRVCKQNVVIYS